MISVSNIHNEPKEEIPESRNFFVRKKYSKFNEVKKNLLSIELDTMAFNYKKRTNWI